MKQNVLKFQSDIKAQVAMQKEKDYCDWWMHPAYCAYYILKHNLENADEYIQLDIKRSYKALDSDYRRKYFTREVNSYLGKYAEVVCADQQ